jgi:hypothetical protein
LSERDEARLSSVSTGTLDRDQTTSRLRQLLKARARSASRGMINHLLPIEVDVVL